MTDHLALWELSRIERLHHSLRKPTRRQMKSKRKSYRLNVKAEQADSMLNMPVARNHRPVPFVQGEREKRLFAAHDKRKAVGWLHG